MTTVHVAPMPENYKTIKKKIHRPQHPPLFQDIDPGGVTPEDYALALELFELLDTESQEWWGGAGTLGYLREQMKKG